MAKELDVNVNSRWAEFESGTELSEAETFQVTRNLDTLCNDKQFDVNEMIVKNHYNEIKYNRKKLFYL